MKNFVAAVIVFSGVVAGAFAHADGAPAAAAYNELTDAQKTAVQNGQQVYIDSKVNGAPWPKMSLYQRIDCTPEEAEAVTLDWPLRTSYTNDLKSAQVSKIVSPTETQVDYVLSMGILGDEPFTLDYSISTYGVAASYRIDWNLVRAKRTKKSEGSTRFETLGTGTLMAITSFVDPGTSLAGIVTSLAISDFKGAAAGFAGQVTKEKQSNQALLAKQVAALRAALGH